MRRGARKLLLAAVLVAFASAALVAGIWKRGATGRFADFPLPLKETHRLFDVGIVDANGDDLLDIYTSNHHFRQSLLLADGKGGYRDVLSQWGLDQSHEFPGAELSFTAPEVGDAGAYIYWLGTNLVIRAHQTAAVGQWNGSLQVYDPVEVVKNEGFRIEKQEDKGEATNTRIEFSPAADGTLVLKPGGQGLPLAFEFQGAIRGDQIHVGLGKVSPGSTRFSLAMRDRHALAWSDFNGDGILDVFINRGALGGTLNAMPEPVRRHIQDELLVSQGEGRFADVAAAAGIDKRGCSGRHVSWVDIDGDGKLDLFVNCYNREEVAGTYPKQLYVRDAQGRMRDVASAWGLDLPDNQIGSFAWLDVDNDTDVDLMTFEDEGIFLYRNRDGRFHRETVLARSAAAEAERIGHTTGSRWLFDGRLTVSDYDADGDPDVFSASQRGNVFLRNDGKGFAAVDPVSAGLPAKSFTASWVDFDNDGLPDLHLVPQGLFRQRSDHKFEATGQLVFSDEQYQAAIANWFDLDNDGRRDLLLALSENPSYNPWWEFSAPKKRRGAWQLAAYRNVGETKHWLQVRLAGASGNRQGIGARVTVVTPDGIQTQLVGNSDGAFFSQGHYRLYFGLGSNARADAVRVQWPDGSVQQVDDIAADRLLVIDRQGAPQQHAGTR